MLNLSPDITEDTYVMVDIMDMDTEEGIMDNVVDWQAAWKHDQELGGFVM